MVPAPPADLNPASGRTVSVHGHQGVLRTNFDPLGFMSVAWAETTDLEVTVNGRGLTGDELLATANELQ